MQPSQSIRILVIDDNISDGEILTALLEAQGHVVTVRQSGADGLREAQAQLPDLILLDVMMPGMDGFTVCAQLRAHPLTAEVPIVMITALDDRASRLRGIEAGADEFLAKPLDRGELRLRVQTIAKINRYRRLLDERERAVVALRQARDAALDASRLKSTFMATVSHELRTPLMGIIGMSELLLMTPLDGEQQEFAQTVLNSGKDLLALVNDILDYTSLEAGTWGLNLATFELAAPLMKAAETLRPSAQAKGLELTLVLGVGVSIRVTGDAARLQLVLHKLIDNAIKFTASGTIRVSIDCIAETMDHVTAEFRVVDSGIGIPEPARLHIFEPFHQVDGSNTRRYGGLGLGLATCRRIVGLMGGSIGVEPVDGPGATFWLQVPLRKALERR